jgi:predicted ABC-type sugar transport system permease subunit
MRTSRQGCASVLCAGFVRAILKSYGLTVALGFILGIAAVFWVRPDSNAGAVFIVFTAILVCFVVGSVVKFTLGLLGRK